jgi:hypothetical protein
MPGSVLAEGDAPAMARPRKYPDELRERAVRLVFESKRAVREANKSARLGGSRRGIDWLGTQCDCVEAAGAQLFLSDS